MVDKWAKLKMVGIRDENILMGTAQIVKIPDEYLNFYFPIEKKFQWKDSFLFSLRTQCQRIFFCLCIVENKEKRKRMCVGLNYVVKYLIGDVLPLKAHLGSSTSMAKYMFFS